MAEVTPDTIQRSTLGHMRLTIANFVSTTIDDDDTWPSGITSIIAHWSEQTKEQTATDFCFDAVSAAGIFTYAGADTNTGTVYVLSADN